MLDKNKVYYLAHLYSLDVDKLETQEEKDALLHKRFNDANRIMAGLSKMGFVIISPISMNHQVAKDYDMPKDGSFGSKIDCALIDRCDAIIVCDEEGVDRSIGIQAELKYAREKNKDIYYRTKSRSFFKEDKNDHKTRYLCGPKLDLQNLCNVQPMTVPLNKDIYESGGGLEYPIQREVGGRYLMPMEQGRLDLSQYKNIVTYKTINPQIHSDISGVVKTYEAKTTRIDANMIDTILQSRFNKYRDLDKNENYNLFLYQAKLIVELSSNAIPVPHLMCYLRTIESKHFTQEVIDYLLETKQIEEIK